MARPKQRVWMVRLDSKTHAPAFSEWIHSVKKYKVKATHDLGSVLRVVLVVSPVNLKDEFTDNTDVPSYVELIKESDLTPAKLKEIYG